MTAFRFVFGLSARFSEEDREGREEVRLVEKTKQGMRGGCREGGGEGREGGMGARNPWKGSCSMAIAAVDAWLEGAGGRKR